MKTLPRFSYHIILWVLLFYGLILIFEKWLLLDHSSSVTIAFIILILGVFLDLNRSLKK